MSWSKKYNILKNFLDVNKRSLSTRRKDEYGNRNYTNWNTERKKEKKKIVYRDLQTGETISSSLSITGVPREKEKNKTALEETMSHFPKQ